MKKSRIIIAVFIILSLIGGAGVYNYLSIQRIDPKQKICKKDDDCGLTPVGCVLGCVGSGQMKAINKTFITEYKVREHCTEYEIRISAEEGACIKTVKESAICQNGMCAVLETPIKH